MSTLSHASITLTGRALLASLFLVSGFGKLTAPGATIGYITSTGLPLPEVALVGALVVELGFAAALLVGYRTKLVASVMALFTLVTAVVFHNQLGDQGQLTHFLKNLSIAGGLLQVVAFGAGAFSLDHVRQAKPTQA
ncbi:DoxX family protein [Pseudomonas putida]|uniref:DoxX family membrane protein n=1 Tax=Pseudomonas putida TaxID=303 RepID=A0A7V8E9H8_PSEPU|nr:DoxX family protein [Pseudomonas putida]KAF0250766.1 DoxX family membrane protein [Pseudomonas putida]